MLSIHSGHFRGTSPNSIWNQDGSPASGDTTPYPAMDIISSNLQDDGSLLDLFRSEMLPLFPFVKVLPSTTPQSLLQEKPILYLAVLVAMNQDDAHRHSSLLKVLREEISRKFMTPQEQDVGFLEGLLVYLAW